MKKSTIIIILLLIITTCALSIGGYSALRKRGAQTATQQEPQGTPMPTADSREGENSSSDAPIPVSVAEYATVEPTATPNHAETQISLVYALGTSQARLNAQNVELETLNLNTAKANAEAEKYRAAQKQMDVDKVAIDANATAVILQASAEADRAASEKMAAENDAAKIAMRGEELAAEMQAQQSSQIMALVMVALAVVFCITALRAITIRGRVEPAPEEGDRVADPPRVHVVDDNTTYPIPTPPGDYSAFLEWAHHARTGGSLAYNKVVGAGLPYPSTAAYAPVWEWAHKYKIVERDINGRVVISARGEMYCDTALEAAKFSASPPPPVDIPQNIPPADHAHDIDAHDSGGEVVDTCENGDID